MSFRHSVILLSLLTALSAPTLANAESVDIDWKKNGKWAALSQYIGTYAMEKVLDDKQVQEMLKTMLDDYKEIDLKKEFAVHGSFGFENDCLTLKGNQVQKADTNRAYMEICLSEGKVNLAIYERGGVQVISDANEYQLLPEGLRQWVYLQGNGDDRPAPTLTSKPMNVQLNKQSKDAGDKSPASL